MPWLCGRGSNAKISALQIKAVLNVLAGFVVKQRKHGSDNKCGLNDIPLAGGLVCSIYSQLLPKRQ